MLEPALADEDPMVRLIGCLAADPRDRADYMYDPSPPVARRAALEWSTVGVRAPSWGRPSCERRIEVALKTARSPHEWVRRVAVEESARLGVDEPGRPATRLQARRLAAQDPASFARLVRDMLHDPERRLDALGLIIALRQEPRFARDLSALAMGHDVDSRTRATAVRGLDGVDDPGARRAARSCLEEEDPRLRANALETRHIPVETLVELKHDAHHRVRSSALRRILMPGGPGARDAIEQLMDMLGDTRGGHRHAGVWAAQRTLERGLYGRQDKRLDPLVERLRTIAGDDPEAPIRNRARRCVRRVRDAAPVAADGTENR